MTSVPARPGLGTIPPPHRDPGPGRALHSRAAHVVLQRQKFKKLPSYLNFPKLGQQLPGHHGSAVQEMGGRDAGRRGERQLFPRTPHSTTLSEAGGGSVGRMSQNSKGVVVV